MTVNRDIWIIAAHTGDAVDEAAFGLIAEARDIISRGGGIGRVTAVILGMPEDAALASLKDGGADRIIQIRHESLNRYNGELFARVLFEIIKGRSLSCLLLAQNEGSSDLGHMLAGMMNAPLITRAVDFSLDADNRAVAIRPISNGYLFEEVIIDTDTPPVVSYLPSVLSSVSPFEGCADTAIEVITPEIDENSLSTRVINVIHAAPENLSIEDAEIVVAGGRGAGKGDAFNMIHDLAKEIGASVGGTRPVIDLQLLPYERQIGQTGKSVAPDLIINCGISGANEYSAGMEKSKHVISINKDPRARIFRFSDLGVVGDLKEIIPLLIERIRELKRNSKR